MENYNRRNRRNMGSSKEEGIPLGRSDVHACPLVSGHVGYRTPPIHGPKLTKMARLKSIWNSIVAFLLLVSLVVIACFVMEYQCSTRETNCCLKHLDKSLHDVAINLATMEKSYHQLEKQVSEFSKELPKLEDQITVLEALAASLEKDPLDLKKHTIPRSQFTSSNVNYRPKKNIDVVTLKL